MRRLCFAAILLLAAFLLATCGSAPEAAAEHDSELLAALAEMQAQIDALQTELDAQDDVADVAMEEAVAEVAEDTATPVPEASVASELEGVWDGFRSGNLRTIDIEGYGEARQNTIEFRGNRFYTTQYLGRALTGGDGRGWHNWIWGDNRQLYADWSGAIVAADRPRYNIRELFENTSVDSRRGSFEAVNNSIHFWRFTTSGTFSVSGNILELFFDDGDIEVMEFQATANTITFRRSIGRMTEETIFHRR